MYPLLGIYLFLPMISPWLRKATARQERFFILLFLISTCMPFLRRWFGELWGECFWNEYHMLWYFSGYLGYVVLAHYIHKHLAWTQRQRLVRGSNLAVAGAASCNSRTRNRLGVLHNQLRDAYRRHIHRFHSYSVA